MVIFFKIDWMKNYFSTIANRMNSAVQVPILQPSIPHAFAQKGGENTSNPFEGNLVGLNPSVSENLRDNSINIPSSRVQDTAISKEENSQKPSFQTLEPPVSPDFFVEKNRQFTTETKVKPKENDIKSAEEPVEKQHLKPNTISESLNVSPVKKEKAIPLSLLKPRRVVSTKEETSIRVSQAILASTIPLNASSLNNKPSSPVPSLKPNSINEETALFVAPTLVEKENKLKEKNQEAEQTFEQTKIKNQRQLIRPLQPKIKEIPQPLQATGRSKQQAKLVIGHINIEIVKQYPNPVKAAPKVQQTVRTVAQKKSFNHQRPNWSKFGLGQL